MTPPGLTFATAVAALLLDFFSRLAFGPAHFDAAAAEQNDRSSASALDPDRYWTDQLLP